MVGVPTSWSRRAGLGARARLGRCCRSPAGTASAARHHQVGRDRRTTTNIFTNYPPFWPGAAAQRDLAGRSCSWCRPRSGCSWPCCWTGSSRFSRFYQSAFFLPVVLSLALVGFIWQLIYSPRPGAAQRRARHSGHRSTGSATPDLNLWAVLVAAGWRHAGYMMLLYLAGLKGVDPSLREAAALDGASEWQTFFRVIFPVLRPINIVVLVVTVIEVAARVRHRLRHQQGPQRAGAAVGRWSPTTSSARPAGSASAPRSP